MNILDATKLIVEQTNVLVNRIIIERGNDKPPFSPYEYAKLFGIKQVSRTDLGELGAMLLKFSDGYEIKINSRHSATRQNFSFAHEIGHMLLNELNLESSVDNIAYRTFDPQKHSLANMKAKERLCDLAATELLMPESVFLRHLQNYMPSIYALERLSSIFNTSVQTTAIRMAEISASPCLALFWKPQQKMQSKTFRLLWLRGPGRSKLIKEYHIPLSETAPFDSAISKAYLGNQAIKSFKSFKTNHGIKRLHMESKGFGYDNTRYVISLAFS